MSTATLVADKATANERFKSGFGSWFWAAMVIATLLHAGLFLVAPTFAIEDFTYGVDELSVTDLADEIEIPPPPQSIARPAAPVIVDASRVLDEDVTIAPTTFDANPAESLPPPPSDRGDGDLAAAPTFTPMTVRPELLNGLEIAEVLARVYPPTLREAGIGGMATVWFFIDEEGRVLRTLLNESSGFDSFDQAAIKVADRMKFSPAYNRDKRVKVWVSVPIVFEVM
jgi:protein TonB